MNMGALSYSYSNFLFLCTMMTCVAMLISVAMVICFAMVTRSVILIRFTMVTCSVMVIYASRLTSAGFMNTARLVTVLL